MRKLKLQVQMSVDGYISGPNGEMDGLVWNRDDKLKKYVNELTESVDTILLGRKMTEGFVSHRSEVMTKPDDPDYAFAKKMIETPKVVFTKKLNKSKWINTDIAKGDLTDELNKLKTQVERRISLFMVAPHLTLH
ncbi:MAG: dihydrofolate reductase family protein [Nitrososphaeraceae archaeon]